MGGVGESIICGIDEAGRGALAGPVAAGAVILGDGFPTPIGRALQDSKALTAQARDELAGKITAFACGWAVGWAGHIEVDRHNVLQATMLAMQRAHSILLSLVMGGGEQTVTGAAGLSLRRPTETPIGAGGGQGGGILGRAIAAAGIHTIVDGNRAPVLGTPCSAVIKADSSVPEVMAASILAKTSRDRWMIAYGTRYPVYEYHAHKGYPTARHRELLRRHGGSPIQRKTFRTGKG